MMINRIFGETGKDLAQNVTVPTLLLTSGGDMQAIRPGGDIYNAFENRDKTLSKDYEDMKHGFVTRGEKGDEEEDEQRKDVMKRAVYFLRNFIPGKSKTN